MRMIRNGWRWLADDPHQLIGVRILQMSIGAVLLFQIGITFPFAGYFWGPHGVGYGSMTSILGDTLGDIFDLVYTSDTYIYCVLFILSIAALGLLFGYYTRVATFLALICCHLIYTRQLDITDGGDNIIGLVLAYMLFLLPHRAKVSSGQLRVWLHNIAVLAITFQIMVVYIASSTAKLIGPMWQQGIATYTLSQVEIYSHPAVRGLFTIPLIAYTTNYVPMVYQLLFPIAIRTRFKFLWIVLGIFFHLGIALLMGLVTFSTVMIASEFFFITDQEYAQLWNRGQLIWKSLSYTYQQMVQKKMKAKIVEEDVKVSRPVPGYKQLR